MNSTDGGARLPTIGVVGAGRAGTALSLAVAAAGYRVVAVASRDPSDASALAVALGAAPVPTALAVARAADLTLVTVPDRAVTSVAATIAASGAALRGRAVVHCAASRGSELLAAVRLTGADVGVLHPLQALAGAKSAALLRGSYFRVEAAGRLEAHLLQLVDALGGLRIRVPRDRLVLYHAAAVLAATAPVTALSRAVQVLERAGVEPPTAQRALAALAHGAAVNAAAYGERAGLTGPVVRGDATTVAAHLNALDEDPEMRELYLAIALQTARLTGRDPVALGLAPAPMSQVA